MKKRSIQQQLSSIINKIKKDKDVLAIILYGSYLRNRKYARDVDLCIVLDKKFRALELGRKRITYLNYAADYFDIQVFQLLPLYVRIKVLKEGRILYSKNAIGLYDVARETIKDYRLFEPHYKKLMAEI